MKKRTAAVVAFAFALALLPATATAGDAAAGAEKAQTCVQCHGEFGAAPIADYPILAGQYEKYLLQSMRDYLNGNRANPMMTSMIKDLSDEDFQDLAAYFAAQDGTLR